MALPVKNSCKPRISVTFTAPQPAADLVGCLEMKGDVGFIGEEGSYLHHQPVRVSHHLTAPFTGATMSPIGAGDIVVPGKGAVRWCDNLTEWWCGYEPSYPINPTFTFSSKHLTRSAAGRGAVNVTDNPGLHEY